MDANGRSVFFLLEFSKTGNFLIVYFTWVGANTLVLLINAYLVEQKSPTVVFECSTISKAAF